MAQAKWLREREGIVVYENHMLDSSHLGETTFMPVRYLAEEDDKLHWAPMQNRPEGGLPSLFACDEVHEYPVDTL